MTRRLFAAGLGHPRLVDVDEEAHGLEEEFLGQLGHGHAGGGALEAAGVLTGRVALADPAKLGLGLTVFVGIEAADHGAAWRDAFLAAVEKFPEVMEAYRMAGEMDYLLHVAVPDMAAYDDFYRRLTDAVPIKNLTSHFAMERLRHTTAYPINTRDR